VTLAAGARGEVLEELDVRAEGSDAVVRVKFAARVQYLNHAPLGRAALVEISFLFVSGAQEANVEERRRLRGRGALPNITVTYPIQRGVSNKRLKVEFSREVDFMVGPGQDNREFEIVIHGAGKDAVAAQAALAPPPPAPFAITLQTFPTGDLSAAPPVPGVFQNYSVFASQSVREGKTEHELNLGYFETREQAEQARRQLLQRFPNARVTDLAQRREETLRATAEAALALPAVTAPPAVPKPPVALVMPPRPQLAAPETDVDRRAAELMASGRAALAGRQGQEALELFNQLLILPPNRYSQDAQELVGVAREQVGEITKAKAEYELYLRLFPEGEGAKRVRERLARLERAPERAPEARPAVARPATRTVFGSVSQFYYGGRSKIETAFNTPLTPDRETISTVDLSSLVSNVDLNGRFRSSESDQRLVFRDTYTKSFRDDDRSFNRLNAAYYDYRSLQGSLSARLGRQTGLSGGVPARFDGALGGINLAQKWRLNAVAGSPVEYPPLDSSRRFYGLNVDFENLADRLSGNLYALNQTVDGILDRRAVGMELRYLRGGNSLYSVFDYDVSYKEWNVAMLQATFQTEGGTVFNALVDRRRAPTLSTTNAVLGQPTTSIKTLLETVSEEQLRQQALSITATATQGLLGFTTPVHPKWQVGVDVRLTNVGALPATEVNNIPIPAQPATGNIVSYVAQAIGSRLYSARDINVFSATYLTSPNFRGQLFSYNNVSAPSERWTIEPSLRYYSQTDTFDVRLRRLTPGLRLTFRLGSSVSLESEYSQERSRTESAMQKEDAVRYFWYAGLRVDF
jgi:tetratricopeptide (TPR) repeat protein